MKLTDLFSFNRSAADRLSQLLVKTPLRPNHITTLSLTAGALGAFAASHGSFKGMLVSAAFLHLRFILDNCDGTIARLKGMTSRMGMWYDLIADVSADLMLWAGLAIGAVRMGQPDGVWWIAGVAAFGSLAQFTIVIRERVMRIRRAEAAGGPRNEAVALLYVLNHDGDPSLLTWVLAPLAGPFIFLICAAVYMNLLWVSSLVFSRSALWRL
ncbi:MAG: CDP-alcohol phosphatidyltransferase family protein [Micavibrio sp.]|nr:CDP-alcohol phosphatidyltransferase family protein [Micavibrio sp.]